MFKNRAFLGFLFFAAMGSQAPMIAMDGGGDNAPPPHYHHG